MRYVGFLYRDCISFSPTNPRFTTIAACMLKSVADMTMQQQHCQKLHKSLPSMLEEHPVSDLVFAQAFCFKVLGGSSRTTG